jgi:putative DNA primase/helicase
MSAATLAASDDDLRRLSLLYERAGEIDAAWRAQGMVLTPDDLSRQLVADGASEADAEIVAGAYRADHPAPAPAAESAAGPPGAIMRRLADVAAEPIAWLWPGRIARGKVTLLAGDPGLGKSYCSLDISARVTTGRAWPDGADACERGSVILLSAEDDAADTIRPRLEAAGADLERVYIFDAIRDKQSRVRCFSLTADMAALEAKLADLGVRLVVIDPISAYLGGIDSHKNTDVRAVLAPLATMASKHKIAILAITHLSKSERDPLSRLSGSIAFGAAARAVWLVAKDPEQPERRLLLSLKNNLAREATGLAFALAGDEEGRAAVAWEPEPVEEMLAAGPRPAKAIEAAAGERGISLRTVRRARALLGIRAYKPTFGGGWIWSAADLANAEVANPGETWPDRQSPSAPIGSPIWPNSPHAGQIALGRIASKREF